MRSLSQLLGRRLSLVAVVVLAVVGVAAIGFSSKGESASGSARGLDRLPAHAQFRSPCDQPVIVLAPESVVLPRDMSDVLRQTVVVADLPVDFERRLLRVELSDPSLRTRLRQALRSLRDRVAVEERDDAISPATLALDAEECKQ